MKNLFLLDATSFLFRSYYAIKKMTNDRGQSTNALYGFVRSVEKICRELRPTHLVAVFDGPDNQESRKKIYEAYKAHRKGMPEDLVPQLDLAMNYCRYAGIPLLQERGVEADDLLGAIAVWAEKKRCIVRICSSDKDLCQLVSDKVQIICTHKNHSVIDREEVKKIYGVGPEQMVDYLALVGDTSDNIPGVPGIGPKTAANLLQDHGSLTNLFLHVDSISNERLRKKLAEYREQVLLNRQLVQLDTNVPFPKEEGFFLKKDPDREPLLALYREMNFASLLKEWEESSSSSPSFGETLEKVDYCTIHTKQQLEELVAMLQKEKEICLDTEADSLDPMKAHLVGIGLGVQPCQAWYIPLNGTIEKQTVFQLLRPLLENPRLMFYGHNLKYDIHVLLNEGISLLGIGFDTILASYLLNPHLNRHSLDALALDEFGKVKTALKDLIGSRGKEKPIREVPIEKLGVYCCEDVDYTCRLKQLFAKRLVSEQLDSLFSTIELPLVPVLVRMERCGMYLDIDQLSHLSKSLEEAIYKVEKEVYEFAGEVFNLKSPKQLSAILFEKLQLKIGANKKSTRAEVLESIKEQHLIIPKILHFRFLEKLRSTYVQSLPAQVNPTTGRIHCSFKQFVTATGRLSCQKPNLQNIPYHSEEGKKIRAAFRPQEPNWSYLSADYSQIELRLLAHLSEDEELLKAFREGEDVHARTAATIFQCPLEEVTKKQRFQAKAVNFGVIYGQQAFGLSKQLGISVKEATAFIRTYFANYPKVESFLEKMKKEAQLHGFAITFSGRKRPLPEIKNANAIIRQAAERFAINAPLQGGQADIIKRAMIAIDRALTKKKLSTRMILQIHDELLFEVPDEELNEVKSIVVELMEGVVSLKIPLLVNLAVGKNWAEC